MIIWVASYPKSGNTWVRSIISSLVYTEDGIFDFPIIKKIDQYPQRRFLEYFTQDYNNIHEIKKHWITSQERINLDTKIKFFKTHHLNCKIDNYPFTNKECTRATIYIVRDPRNLIDSISNHFSKSIEESKKFLLTSKILSPDKEIELRQKVANLYSENLGNCKKIQVPFIPKDYKSVWAQYSILLENDKVRSDVIDALRLEGVPSVVYYQKALHL